MKFGNYLIEACPPGSRFSSIDYAGLKAYLKDRSKKGVNSWEDSAESSFIELLDQELDKVSTFSKVKHDEYQRHIQDIEERVNTATQPWSDEERTGFLKELDNVCKDITDLGQYNTLNYTAFLKIVKKHDKYTNYHLKYAFMAKLNQCSFYKNDFDSLTTPIGQLYARLRPAKAKPEGGKSGTPHTLEFWVNPTNVTELRLALVRHLPMVAYREESSPEPTTLTHVSTVYLDDSNLKLYHQNIYREDGALSLRYRWYGRQPDQVYVERQVLRRGLGLVESRETKAFSVKEKHMKAFAAGEPIAEPRHVTHSHDREAQAQAANELEVRNSVQAEVQGLGLRPVLRTTCKRTSYQKATSAFSVMLDVDVAMMREEGRVMANEWHRTDTAGLYPLTDVPANDVTLFPYGVVVVQFQTDSEEAKLPKWFDRMISTGLLQEAPLFSKYIHGCAVLLEQHTHAVPPWLPKLEGLPSQSSNRSSMRDDSDDEMPSAISTARGSQSTVRSGLLSAMPSTGLLGEAHPTYSVVPMRNDKTRHSTGGDSTSMLNGSIRQPQQLLAKLGQWCCDGLDQPGIGPGHSKPIAVPVRVEPKVYFANERTFLNWVHVAVLLTTTSVAMLSVADGHTDQGVWWSGATLGFAAILFLLYGVHGYYRRDKMLKMRSQGPYGSVMGPVLVVSVFMLMLVTNMISWLRNNDEYMSY